jgi:hypothetical protein
VRTGKKFDQFIFAFFNSIGQKRPIFEVWGESAFEPTLPN